jgi:MFS family permease
LITRALVLRLGLGQMIGWGVTYHLVGIFAPRIAKDLGWSLSAVQGGFAVGLLAMAAASPMAGRAIDHRGRRLVMAAGSLARACSRRLAEDGRLQARSRSRWRRRASAPRRAASPCSSEP